ncbi:MAG: hypothetical protein FJX75_13620 [Armatimonadetes bacterium]|nr:hypothetical protein [Armatimonadota bacterium]
MQRRGIWTLRIVSILKKVFLIAALLAAGYGGYRYYMLSRPALPDTGADWVAYQYLVWIQQANYEAAYMLASSDAQSQSNPGMMSETCKEVYSAIDSWELGPPKYRFTHRSASVPVMLRYRPAWSVQEVQVMQGNIDFKLEKGDWRLVAAVPFATAIMKQRDEQHFAGSRQK